MADSDGLHIGRNDLDKLASVAAVVVVLFILNSLIQGDITGDRALTMMAVVVMCGVLYGSWATKKSQAQLQKERAKQSLAAQKAGVTYEKDTHYRKLYDELHGGLNFFFWEERPSFEEFMEMRKRSEKV